jgi:short-subunit dehydrogenase
LPPPIHRSVVVITGASSGIGHAAALEFARKGARLVVAGRESDDLDAVRRRCEEFGAEAIAVSLDVAVPGEAERLARAAEERFGAIDTWVNCAGVIAYGTFEQLPADVFRRVIETNLMGQVEGARAALERFHRDRAGVLINLSSVWGQITTPLVSPYAVSKHAVRAFSECLRHELGDEPDIYVATIVPQAVDTPIFDHAANYTGRKIRALPPVFSAEKVAEGIVACARSPKREVTYGRTGRALEILYAVLPELYCRVMPGVFMRGSFAQDAAAIEPGNVFTGCGGGRSTGGWRTWRKGDLRRGLLAATAGGILGIAGRGSRTKPADPTM